MINKKNVLGKNPHEAGLKDAIHTAIVSVRAGCPMSPGTRCTMKNGEAFPNSNGPGLLDPWYPKYIRTGDIVWMVLDQDEIPTVYHMWEHPSIDFTPSTKPIKKNSTIAEIAEQYGVSYEEIMEAAELVLSHKESAQYPTTGSLNSEELDEVNDNFYKYDFWSEFASETGHIFENIGSECCPEYLYPDCSLFKFRK